MNTSGRTTLSFLDLALMLLSAFAYTHFMTIADADTSAKTALEKPANSKIYDYDMVRFFADSNAMLTPFARAEISRISEEQSNRKLTISVAPVRDDDDGDRLWQWEKVAARTAAIADAFQKAGQDSAMITLKTPEKFVTETDEKGVISLIFAPADS